jgi:hypothetical protein
MDDEFDGCVDEDEHDDDDSNEDGGNEDGWRGQPWPTPGQPHRDPVRRHMARGAWFAGTAVIAAAAGFGVMATALHDLSSSPAASAAPGSSAPAPGNSGNTGNTGNGRNSGGAPVQIPSTGPGQTLRMEIGSKVSAVSATSITLGGPGRQVTATVTKATTVTGKVTSIAGVKVGDLVMAQITSTDGKLTVTAIQDPASVP